MTAEEKRKEELVDQRVRMIDAIHEAIVSVYPDEIEWENATSWEVENEVLALLEILTQTIANIETDKERSDVVGDVEKNLRPDVQDMVENAKSVNRRWSH